ncbi:MAG: hypothetical protein IT449_19150 [Phycisphaerales bacterium]|nr:hypothetical protein [Phycisphaerales bacterium]
MMSLHEWLLGGASASWLSTAQTAILTLGLFVAGAVVISSRRRAKDRQNSPQACVRERTRRIEEEERRVAEDVEAVMIRLEQLARKVEAQVNEQLARLESATHAADERIRALHESVPPARSRTSPSPSIDFTVDDAVATPAAAGPGTPAKVERRESLAQSVARLAARGKSPRQIARELSRSVGEVELALAVERARGQAALRIEA